MAAHRDIKLFLSDEKMWISYNKKKLIGMGENSHVFECKLTSSTRQQKEFNAMDPLRKFEIERIAIKIHSPRIDNGEFILKTLNHSNIPKLIGHGSDLITKEMFYGLTFGKGGDLMSRCHFADRFQSFFHFFFFQRVYIY